MHGGLWREDLFGGISEFSVQAQLLSVDMECAIDITSFGEPECQTTEETMQLLSGDIYCNCCSDNCCSSPCHW